MSNATFGTNFETSLPISISCDRCKNVWQRTFIPNKRISCSHCKTSIVMPSLEEYNRLKQTQIKEYKTGKGELMFLIPHTVLMDRKFRRALSWAESNGEDMVFQSDDECRLNLV